MEGGGRGGADGGWWWHCWRCVLYGEGRSRERIAEMEEGGSGGARVIDSGVWSNLSDGEEETGLRSIGIPEILE